jgi:hypothetical protein
VNRAASPSLSNPTGPTREPYGPVNRAAPFPSPSVAGEWTPRVSPPFSSPNQPAHPTAAPPVPSHPLARTPRDRAPAREPSQGRGKEKPLLPPRLAPVTASARRGGERRRHGRPGGPSRGSPGISPCPGGAVDSKARGGEPVAVVHRHQPTLGFCPYPEPLRRRGKR